MWIGHGHELAIVQAIGEAHRATATAQPPRQGGLDIEISFSSLPRLDHCHVMGCSYVVDPATDLRFLLLIALGAKQQSAVALAAGREVPSSVEDVCADTRWRQNAAAGVAAVWLCA